MHVRPLKQYLYHGSVIVAVTIALPWAVALNTMEDWAKGKTLKGSLKTTLVDFGEGIFSLLDDVSDMSYLDHGDGIEL